MQQVSPDERALLHADNIEVEVGMDLLYPDLSFRADLSDDLLGGSIQRSMLANIHGRCTLELARPLTWGVDLVKPWMRLYDKARGTTGRWDLGVYMLTTPERIMGETPETYSADGYDRLYLLDRQVGRDYSASAGTTYRKALTDAFTAAGLTGFNIEGSAADHTLPRDRIWPLVPITTDPDQTDTPVTWLRVINDLCLAINFRGVWADPNGIFRCSAYQDPINRGAEFVFDANDVKTIIGEERRVTDDIYKVPNRWVFIASNPPEGVIPSESNGYIYVAENINEDQLSQVQRDLTWASVFRYEVASQQLLIALGNRRVSQDRNSPIKYNVTTGPFPPAGHFDIFTYADEGTRKVQAVEWDMPLDGGDVSWVWEEVSATTTGTRPMPGPFVSFYNTDAAVTAINAAGTLEAVRAAAAPVASAYGITIDLPTTQQIPWPNWTAPPLLSTDLASTRTVVAACVKALSQYPISYVRKTGLKSVGFVKDIIAQDGGKPGGVYNHDQRTVWIDCEAAPTDWASGKIFHHEYAHCIQKTPDMQIRHAQMAELNDPTKPYGGIWTTSQGSTRPIGYTLGGWASATEDEGEIHAFYMTPSTTAQMSGWLAGDVILARKFALWRAALAYWAEGV